MIDPIGAFNRIRDFYISYLETAFYIRDPAISGERRALLEAAGSLCTEPIIEPITRYRNAPFKLHELVHDAKVDDRVPGLNSREREAFVHLALSGLFEAEPRSGKGGLPNAKYAPYLHQAEMLKRGVCPGNPTIVTSGTGSGKTEAFLLPIFAELAREALRWTAPAQGFLSRRWWQDSSGNPVASYTTLGNRPLANNPNGSPFVPQRQGETRSAAMRALILYPMNALVEDQLARLRRALDSTEARACMDRFFSGNRIFLGKYTSATPVTGYHRDPTPESDEYKRRERKLRKLFKAVCQMQGTQEAARAHSDPDAHYLFPSVDGDEMTSRWDMQEHPPDILITNTSMLNAMLAREVDSPIFRLTRDWLLSSNESYFFLVLDELHLQRGSAGTEVSFLLRLLIERLGLDDARHRHKLRILASSASLPLQGEARDASLQYLWDFFGSNGSWSAPGESGQRTKDDWRTCVLAGHPVTVATPEAHLRPEPFIDFLAACKGLEDTLAVSVPPEEIEPHWRALCTELAPDMAHGRLEDVVKTCIEQSGLHLERACSDEGSSKRGPVTVNTLCRNLFGAESRSAPQAVRGLLVVRGLGDSYRTWYPRSSPLETVSFRIHLFFRSIEGLFAPALLGDPAQPAVERRLIGSLTVERGLRFAEVAGAQRRLLELVYCECCGELFFAGMKGKRRDSSVLELLPIDPDLDGLPDSASSQLFEELTAETFGVFWPRESSPPPGASNTATADWRKASLNPVTGVVRLASNRFDPWAEVGEIHGFLYDRNPNRLDRHQRTSTDPGSCVPYACPACGTSYEFRKKGYRLSPLRNFRAGFAKTTQLLATEVFEVLRQTAPQPKLVSFSDSRQDAAKAALDIERRHHEDLARQILVEAIRDVAGRRVSTPDLRNALQANKAAILASADDDPKMDEILAENRRLRALLANAEDPAIPLTEIVETLDSATFQGLLPDRAKLRPYLLRFVRLGVHPVDGTGAKKFRIGAEWRMHEWYEFFTSNCDGIDWRDLAGQRNDIDDVRREIVRESLETISQTVFNKTYFSLEETGLGYPTIPLSAARDADDQDVLAAYVRVLGDSYRVNESPYDTRAKDWTGVQDIGPGERVLRFATAALGDGTRARAELSRVLAILDAQRHPGGIIHTGRLSIRVPQGNDPYWRCPRCGRVHLHKGARICTRCFGALGPDPSGTVEEIRRANFLGKRVERGEPVFRVRCEELTGQTDDPAERQRRFRGILFPAPSELEENARLIDLLAVTTTMEVGIDIGPLQAVFQANMPPQRFNYQQRVGRAGRRGQAFSSVMTVCRSKSHDLYYFRHPARITGDPPPPPFLTKRQVIIARRLLRKAWLAKAFENIRAECRRIGTPYPGDDATPDIHGEFIPSRDYFDPAQNWPARLRDELETTRVDRDRFAAVLSADSEIRPTDLVADLEPDHVLEEIRGARELLANDVRDGLAHTLAEAGLLPMFGMPTRVRNLYVDTLEDEDDHQREWSTIDRDLDLAIFEFAPGSIIVKDKQQHRSIGFTGQLENPFRPGNKTIPRDIAPYTPAFGDPFWLVQCTRCGSWHRFNVKPNGADCKTCGYVLPDDRAGECVTPAGFRTDLRPGLIRENDRFGSKHRSITAEFRELQLIPGGSNISTHFLRQARTYRLNRGGDTAGNTATPMPAGFSVDGFSHTLPGLRHTRLLAQSIATDLVPPNGYQPDAGGSSRTNVWLAAAKTTDSLFMAVTAIAPGLRLERVSGENRVVTSVRAAALSATFIVVHRAALDLDIDPEEFDIVDPRVHLSNGAPVPVLQITDHLVNGSGFCERLAMKEASGDPYVTRMIGSAVNDPSAFPLKEYRGSKNGVDHAAQCDQSCYLCLQRYGNQSYHGLLDWRLGLSFLECLHDPQFSCGLDGNFEASPSLSDWPALARRYATALVTNYRSNGEVIDVGKLTAFRFDRSQKRWALVVHPLWDIGNPSGILEEAIRQIGSPPEFSDTFELSRRQVSERERLRREWNR
ncbi:MAG: DEAD/DEAH box helicase [Acidobacteria bacterium]|nr:DEAD/DEAH box helicase [Acidobacteriota bacterium]